MDQSNIIVAKQALDSFLLEVKYLEKAHADKIRKILLGINERKLGEIRGRLSA